MDAGAAGRAALSVALVPLPHFTLLPFAGFIDTLRLAADEGDRSRPRACNWTVMAPDLEPVPASCGAEVLPWETLREPSRFDYVAVVGGLLHRGRPGLDRRTAGFLRQAAAARVTLIGICTGSLALIEAGVIPEGRPVCVSWYHYQDLRQRHPGVRPVADRLWLRDGRVITCAGGTAAVDLAASLVQTHLGGSAAQKSLHIMVADGSRPASAAQPQPPNTREVADTRVRRAMLLMEQNLAAPLSADALAAGASVSKRQLERLFRQELGASVQAFARDLRLFHSVWLLAKSPLRITDVAMRCGFADPAHFNRQFRAAFGAAPSAARRAGPSALLAALDRWWPHGGAPRLRDRRPPTVRAADADRRPYR